MGHGGRPRGAVGARLNELACDSLRVLHDRKIPRSDANTDHLAVTPNGIFVIDAKRYSGRPALVFEGGLIRPRVEKLTITGRDRTKVVDGVIEQVEVVRGLVGPEVPVRGVLCFVEADWPLMGGSFTTRDVAVLWPKKLYPAASRTGTAADKGPRESVRAARTRAAYGLTALRFRAPG
jgi:hypothetical protein